MTIMKFCSVFEALGCEIRLQVFDFIMQAGEDGVAPKEIVEQFGVDSGTLQFHLKKLINVNLVSKKIPEEIGVTTAPVISQQFFSN